MQREPVGGLPPSGSPPSGDPERDPALRIGRYHRADFGRGYGLEVIQEEPGNVGYRWTKCDILASARREGNMDLAFCEGHEAWWQEIAKSVDPAPDLRVTQNMRDGAPWCEVWIRSKKAAR